MSTRDPEQERQRLRATYANLTDGELEKLAADETSLTDEARQVLQYELTIRSLNQSDIREVLPHFSTTQESGPAFRSRASSSDQTESEENEEDDEEKEGDESDLGDDDPPPVLVTIRRFRDLPEALLAKGGLNSAGIECYLMDENMVRLDWFISNFVGGVKLQVRPEDVKEANQILDQPIPEGFEVEGSGEYEQPRCPKCCSLDVVFEELNKPIAFGSAFLHFPIPVHNRGWKCRTCGCEWDDQK